MKVLQIVEEYSDDSVNDKCVKLTRFGCQVIDVQPVYIYDPNVGEHESPALVMYVIKFWDDLDNPYYDVE